MEYTSSRKASSAFLLFVYIASLLMLPTMVQAGDPEVTVSRFQNHPSKFMYFDDSPVVLMHDIESHTVYRSSNEGKDWDKLQDIGDAYLVIEHPHDKSMAFIMGKDTTHWVTHDQGDSWKTFDTPIPPSMINAPLAFHATKPKWILFQGSRCVDAKWGWGDPTCWDETYYTKDAFRDEVSLLLEQTSQCIFGRGYAEATEAPEDLVLCVAYDSKPTGKHHRVEDGRLFKSTDWFKTKDFVDFGLGKRARGVARVGTSSKFIVVALYTSNGDNARRDSLDRMQLFVTTDGSNWRRAQFPYSALPNLVENGYTIVQASPHSITIDIPTSYRNGGGNLFVSSDEGTYFVESLADTNHNDAGIVDFEQLQNIEGVAIANIVSNRDRAESLGEPKKLQSRITYDDGSNWREIPAPEKRFDGSDWDCDTSDTKECGLHLHSVTVPHNLGATFSSLAPGYVMAVGSVGDTLLPYDECDTFLSTDAGNTWTMVQEGAQKYEFGDQGSILVLADDEGMIETVQYSTDGGQSWQELDLGVSIRVTVLTTIPDGTSQKFVIIGTLGRRDANRDGRYAIIFLDFANIQKRQCGDSDFEKWYARSGDNQCIMGHKQWYMRRKLDADCFVGHKFEDPVGHEENCPCTADDFECDFNFVREGDKCVAVGPETVPEGTCKQPSDTYMGSSGFRLIPGNTCDRRKGQELDKKVSKPCSKAKPADGDVSHVVHEFDSSIVRHHYFDREGSETILLQTGDEKVFQSRNEAYSWNELFPNERFLSIVMHAFDSDRAYLLTNGKTIYYTTNTGGDWHTMSVPADPNPLGISLLNFHPTKSDWLIYTGAYDCGDRGSDKCRAVSFYTTDHGRKWNKIEEYTAGCDWARDARFKIDDRMIICELHEKSGSQRDAVSQRKLVSGRNFFRDKEVLFDSVVGYTVFSEYLLVAEYHTQQDTLSLEVSLDGKSFAEAQFPPNMRIDNRAYTVLESNTNEVFLHVTMNAENGQEWGSIFKSNSNGTYYGLSAEHVNRDTKGYVDFEKMIGLDGIALVNIVSNPDTADVSGRKKLQTRITHNDGGSWEPLNPPERDSLGQKYDCSSTKCSLQIHGYTERRDPRATYSSPSAIGLMLGVGNVGEELAPYTDSDIFLTRDGGFSWEEVHKDAHMWEFGDSGAIIVLANDEEPVDHVLFSTDEGLTWQTYSFGVRLRVRSLQTVPNDTSRRFFLIGQRTGNNGGSVLVHLDFSSVLTRQCQLDLDDPNNDDFELWSPAESREEPCLFGRQVQYHRRIRDANCYIGKQLNLEKFKKIQRNCSCTLADFECEFNHYRSPKGDCVLIPGASPLGANTELEQCTEWESSWYDRTAYRKIPYSSCEGGLELHHGKQHSCPGLIGGGSNGFVWGSLILLPFMCAGVAVWWWVKKGGRPGVIRLGEHRAFGGSSATSDVLQTLASVPYFLLGLLSAAWTAVERRVPFLDGLFVGRRNYRHVPVDDDAEILGGYADDD